jgi:hypothetical protein
MTDLPALREAVGRAAAAQVDSLGPGNAQVFSDRDTLALGVIALLDEVERLRADLMGQRDAYDILLAHANELERDNAALQTDLAAARAVLDDADVEYDDPDIDAVTIIVDRAAWLAWQGRAR